MEECMGCVLVYVAYPIFFGIKALIMMLMMTSVSSYLFSRDTWNRNH